jgi:hypothetical protein
MSGERCKCLENGAKFWRKEPITRFLSVLFSSLVSCTVPVKATVYDMIYDMISYDMI